MQLIIFAVVLNIEFISSMTFLPPEIERNSFLCIISGINMYIFEEKKPLFEYRYFDSISIFRFDKKQ